MAINSYRQRKETVDRAKRALDSIIEDDLQVIEGILFVYNADLCTTFKHEISKVVRGRIHEIMELAIQSLEYKLESKRKKAVREALLFVGEHYRPEDGPEIEDE